MAREPFNRIWTETPTEDFGEPTNNMWDKGWGGGADQDPPEAYAQNWWQNRVDYALRALERLGALTWHPDAEYQRGAVAVGSDGEKYLSVTGTESTPNTGNDPVSDGGANWIRYYDGGPPGQVSAFAMSAPPAGWLKANGATVSRAQYARLFDAIGTTFGAGDGSTTFNLPDARGEFMRGWDDGRGVDLGREIGSTQAGSVEYHTHKLPTSNGATPLWGVLDTQWEQGSNSAPGSGELAITYDRGASSEGQIGGNFSNETRPRNVALLYCIKY